MSRRRFSTTKNDAIENGMSLTHYQRAGTAKYPISTPLSTWHSASLTHMFLKHTQAHIQYRLRHTVNVELIQNVRTNRRPCSISSKQKYISHDYCLWLDRKTLPSTINVLKNIQLDSKCLIRNSYKDVLHSTNIASGASPNRPTLNLVVGGLAQGLARGFSGEGCASYLLQFQSGDGLHLFLHEVVGGGWPSPLPFVFGTGYVVQLGLSSLLLRPW